MAAVDAVDDGVGVGLGAARPVGRRVGVGAEVELVGQEQREYRLRNALKPLLAKYDYVIIDCPPSLGLLTLNALTATDSVIIPLQCEYYALEGLSQLIQTIDLVKQGLNPSLMTEGILLTMFDGRANIAHQVADDVRGHFKEQVFAAIVPRNIRLAECPSFGKSVFEYAPKSSGAADYAALAVEVLGAAGPQIETFKVTVEAPVKPQAEVPLESPPRQTTVEVA